jgi:hypothetical protein
MSHPLAGRWDVRVKTPVGSLSVVYTFTESAAGLNGVAQSSSEIVQLTEIVERETPAGRHVTWHQRVTRPLRLNIDFDVVVTSDDLHGYARAGRLPPSRVTGHRCPPSERPRG